MFLLSWDGRGYWVGIVGVVTSLIGDTAVQQATGDSNYYAEHHWPMALVALASAIAIRIIWRGKSQPPQPNLIVEPDRSFRWGIPPTSDSFIFIPIRWWIRVLLALSVGLLIAELATIGR